MNVLKKDELNLLKVCLKIYRPDLLWTVANGEIVNLNETLKDDLIDTVVSLYCSVGVNPDETPNFFGEKLDLLLTSLFGLEVT